MGLRFLGHPVNKGSDEPFRLALSVQWKLHHEPRPVLLYERAERVEVSRVGRVYVVRVFDEAADRL